MHEQARERKNMMAIHGGWAGAGKGRAGDGWGGGGVRESRVYPTLGTYVSSMGSVVVSTRTYGMAATMRDHRPRT